MDQTLLIVDDFASVRLYHTSFLTRKGYRCVVASNGAEALAALRAQAVDLIVLDMMMPVMDGAALLDSIGGDPALGAIPVLAITSEAPLPPDLLRPRAGALRVLAKPVMPHALLESVQQLLAPAAVRAPAIP